MAISVLLDRQEILPKNPDDVAAVISRIMNNRDSEAAQISVGGDDLLIVSVNSETGYGAIVWFVSRGSARKGGIYDHVWISDNPNPPQSDPRVFADLQSAIYHDRLSTIPAPQVQKALEEYFETGTGTVRNPSNGSKDT
ncbi:Imm1 family immunity protein [Actinoplanes sp. NPDC051411]|uniref:Imm1 family immunity protein n=1 Tax=Actinoplanes sp. NPDC051411 TaxID=3155522 RepID=UPI003416D946